jgi:DNA-3-methyladenine glycosylase
MIFLSELERLDKQFYLQNALDAARNLLGKYLIRKIDQSYAGGMIVETEAYLGPHDDAAHSYNFKKTKRNEAMYEEGGIAYVYKIYGIHFCLNVVTNKKDKPEAVLIRAIQPEIGIEMMQLNRQRVINNLTNGPAKLCQALGIDLRFNKKSLLGDDFFIAQSKSPKTIDIEASKRINIDYAAHFRNKLWRFYIKNNRFVSR